MTKNQQRLLQFAILHPGWHTCGPDSIRTMNSLESAGLLIVERYDDASPRFKLPTPDQHCAIEDTNRLARTLERATPSELADLQKYCGEVGKDFELHASTRTVYKLIANMVGRYIRQN